MSEYLQAPQLHCYQDVREYRFSPTGRQFAERWVAEQRSDDLAGDCHRALWNWNASHPLAAIAILLNIIDLLQGDSELLELVAMNPVTDLLEKAGGNALFQAVLRDAVADHAGFRDATAWMRRELGLD